MSVTVTVLGCGGAGGTPLIGNEWGACDPTEPRNRRLRPSVLMEVGGLTILIDTSPDLREQLLAANVRKLDAVLFTHAHADHCHGLDDLRSLNWIQQAPIPIYADAKTLADLEKRFDYAFRPPGHRGYYKPVLDVHEITGPFHVGDVPIIPFVQDHGPVQSLGFRIQDFAYSTDAKGLDDAAFRVLAGIKGWIVDCIGEDPHPTHSHLAQSLDWIRQVGVERAWLTHMNGSLDYRTLCGKLPVGVEPAYDGLKVEV
jgi:phosphoribosyl 1,2-cyclic phosphate phosphodiesterase